MTVNIPAEFAPLAESLVASSQFGSEHEVVAYAVRLLQAANEQEQQLIQDLRLALWNSITVRGVLGARF
jgi:Arc/MetJ-type ribon-helix-helix transcriptional regulator